MGLFDALTSKKQTQTTNATTNVTGNRQTTGNRQATTTPWLEDLVKGYAGDIGSLDGMDPNSFVPGASGLQSKSFADAYGFGGMNEAYRGGLDMAAAVGNAAAPRTEFVKSSAMMKDFMNPYLDDVVNASLADFDFGAGQTRAQQDLDLAGAGAFGGSGAALTKSMTEDALTRGRARTAADLRSQAFNTAAQLAMAEAGRKQGANDLNAQLYGQQADRTLNAAGALTDIASAFEGNNRSNTALTADLGAQQRDIEQQRATALLDFLGARGDLMGRIPFDLFSGETYNENTDTTGTTNVNQTTKTKGSGSPMETAGQAAQIAALFFSDRRLKADVEPLFRRDDGLWVYAFRYLWSPIRHIGVMAQEVMKTKPEAVRRHPSGFLMVNYAAL